MELRLPKEASVRTPQLLQSPRTKTPLEPTKSPIVVAAVEKMTMTKQQPVRKGHKRSGNEEEEEDQQQNDDDEYEDEEEEDNDCESDDDAKSYTSNQTEDDDESDDELSENDEELGSSDSDCQENDRDAVVAPVAPVSIKTVDDMKKEAQLPPLVRPVVSSSKPLPGVLSVPVADPKKKNIQEPRPPRGSSTSGTNMATSNAPMSKSESKKARQKFQFPDSELLNLVLEDEEAASQQTASSSSRGASSSAQQRRRYSSTAAMMATTLPLRRKSFSLTKGPVKSYAAAAAASPIAGPPTMSPAKATTRFQARRKSTSACYSLRSFGAKSPLPSKFMVSSLPSLSRAASASPMATAAAAAATVVLPPTSSSATSQMVLRVRERKSDGLPELVISKRPARFLVWNWNDRQVRVPFKIQLGPHQHGIMLRQLRYVKSVMNDFPWAKTHLKELLAAYTTKDMSKEELYPQLNQLSSQVQQEIGTQVKKQKTLLVKKQRLTMQLSLATSVINEMHVTKYGRRGKPHDTKLYYDPGQPTRLHWIRKNGERSAESLDVDIIEIHCYESDSKESELSAGIKKALRKFTQTTALESCVSLVTPSRTLDVQLKSPLHREWLVNALCDVISFARQYRAAGARREQQPQPAYTHLLRRM